MQDEVGTQGSFTKMLGYFPALVLGRAIHGPTAQSRGRLLTNFQGLWARLMSPQNKAPRDWSIRISSEIHMTNGSQFSLKVVVYTGIGP